MMSPGQNNWPFVINVGNSIIGVTVLAMPFCFQACGIILGILLLLFSTWLTNVSCQLLMKAGVTSRRRSYSLLAFYTHGATGKLIVELGMIGLQIGTLVAQVVIIGDLGPGIVSKATGLSNSNHLRTCLIIFLCLFVGLPLGLLKDVRMLSKTSSLCIAFYTFFSVYIVLLSVPNLASGDWYHRVNFWRIEGLFECLPIFSFAFGCQTQLFIVYDALAEPSLKRINSIVSSAVNMCTVSYLLVGFFGYIAFCNSGDLSGDIINHFRKNTTCDVIKLLFVFSIAVSIPLIVFPCRASLFTLCFSHRAKEDIPGSGKMPETHFRVITIIIVVGSMTIGILIPNIEFVLGLNGATMGTLICYIFPALFFLNVMSDKSERLFTSRAVLVLGFVIMIASTYTILHTKSIEVDNYENNPVLDVSKLEDTRNVIEKVNGDLAVAVNRSKILDRQEEVVERHEPPVPQEPIDPPDIKSPDIEDRSKKRDVPAGSLDEKNKIKQVSAELNKDQEQEKKTGGETLDKGMQEAKGEEKQKESEEKHNVILAKLEQQQVQQEKLIQEQKEILEQLKQHKEQEHDHISNDKHLNAPVHQQGQLLAVPNVPNQLPQNRGPDPPVPGQQHVQVQQHMPQADYLAGQGAVPLVQDALHNNQKIDIKPVQIPQGDVNQPLKGTNNNPNNMPIANQHLPRANDIQVNQGLDKQKVNLNNVPIVDQQNIAVDQIIHEMKVDTVAGNKDKVQNVAVGAGDINHRVKRDTDIDEHENLQETVGRPSDNAEIPVKIPDKIEGQVDSGGQRDLKQLIPAVQEKYGREQSVDYVEEMLEGLKYKMNENIGGVGNAIVDKVHTNKIMENKR